VTALLWEGQPVSPEMHRRIESLLSAAQTPTVLCRSVQAPHVEVNHRTGIVRAIISDDSNERFSTVFDPYGCEWDGWEHAGMPLLYEHGTWETRGTLPVGNAVKDLERTKFKGRDSIVMETRLWDDDEFAKKIGDAYRSMKMRGWSIRTRPIEQSPPNAKERAARGDWAQAHTVSRRWELLEVSTMTVAGNANAVTIDVARSLAASTRDREQASIMAAVLKAQRVEFMQDLTGDIRRLAEANQRPRGPRAMGT